MTSERTQRRVQRLLDEAEQAMDQEDWPEVETRARQALRLDPDNVDARSFLSAAQRGPAATPSPHGDSGVPDGTAVGVPVSDQPVPTSFASGRYEVKRFLGEGGKKKVYLAHDTLLDRDVAFALIKTEGLDDTGRDRIRREAQAMGRLGAHPHIVSVFDLGEEADGQPYIVTELMGGGDVEGLIEKAPEHRRRWRRGLRPEIRDTVAAAQLQADQMIDLIGAGCLWERKSILGKDCATIGLSDVPDATGVAGDAYLCRGGAQDGARRTRGVRFAVLHLTAAIGRRRWETRSNSGERMADARG